MSRVLPILFNTDMVRAILDGRKTVTRRVIKKLPDDAEFSGWLLDSTCQEDAKDIGSAGFKTLKQSTEKAGCLFVKPPYQPEDILYVRETWLDYAGRFMYKADCDEYRLESLELAGFNWHPSIHMPKEAARIWLKVNDVRVERLQEMTQEDAEKEGAQEKVTPITKFRASALLNFMYIWDSTIKKSDLDRYGWDANPYVWVIEFERCEKPDTV